MSKECDERPLAEIRFAQDAPKGGTMDVETAIRVYFERVGVKVGQDIIDLGCTGLVVKLRETSTVVIAITLNTAQYIRRNMSGSICGLPCYVPRDRFCFVHDTIGGLQVAGNMDGPQAPRHPEALPLMSRELTEDERRTVAGINAKLAADAKEKALAEYGAEAIEDEATFGSATPTPSCPIPQPPFKCSNHKEPEWGCRKCVAQAVFERGDQIFRVCTVPATATSQPIGEAMEALEAGELRCVELWTVVASWSKKVTRG
jgi:hypothetical protein